MTPNCYARITPDGRVLELLLPDESTQLLPCEPAGEDWYAVAWPVPPHYTGRRMIAEMLEAGFPERTPL